MTSPQSLPVEEARKRFADLLDDSQFRSTHTAITRRGKTAGYVVPPEWYARAVEALAQDQGAPTAVAQQPKRDAAPVKKAAPKPRRRYEPRDGRPLTDEEAKALAEVVRARATPTQLKGLEQDVERVPDGLKDFTWVSAGMSMGLLTHDEVYGPASSEEA
jgi:PHD/YefM family antitoxin component YafN of YafNO toxin-antitoxin module